MYFFFSQNADMKRADEYTQKIRKTNISNEAMDIKTKLEYEKITEDNKKDFKNTLVDDGIRALSRFEKLDKFPNISHVLEHDVEYISKENMDKLDKIYEQWIADLKETYTDKNEKIPLVFRIGVIYNNILTKIDRRTKIYKKLDEYYDSLDKN